MQKPANMNHCILQIECTENYNALVQSAGRNGSIDTLINAIMNLTLGASTHDRRVLLRATSDQECYVAWYAKGAEQPYMVGGLIYHEATNDWAVHTGAAQTTAVANEREHNESKNI